VSERNYEALTAEARRIVQHIGTLRRDLMPDVLALAASVKDAPAPFRQLAIIAWAHRNNVPSGFQLPPAKPRSISTTGTRNEPTAADLTARKVAAWLTVRRITDPQPTRSQSRCVETDLIYLAKLHAFAVRHEIDLTADAPSVPADREIDMEMLTVFGRPLDRDFPLSEEAISTEIPPAVSTEIPPYPWTEPGPAEKPQSLNGRNRVGSLPKTAPKPHRPLQGVPYHTGPLPSPEPKEPYPHPTEKRRTASTPAPSLRSGSGTLNAISQPHRRRDSSDVTAHEIAHVRLAERASRDRSTALNVAIMVRLEETKAYRTLWNPKKDGRGKTRSPNSNAEREARRKARKAASKAFFEAIQNLSRKIGPVPYIAIHELPAHGGSGLHVHALIHMPDRSAVRMLVQRLATLTQTSPETLKLWQDDPKALTETIKSHHMPFDVRGEASFLREPQTPFMCEERVLSALSYFLKSAPDHIPATIDGRSVTLGNIRPEQDEKKHLRHRQPIRAYQRQQDMAEMNIGHRLRFSRDLQCPSLTAAGYTSDRADDAGWMHREERVRRLAKTRPDAVMRLPRYAPHFLPSMGPDPSHSENMAENSRFRDIIRAEMIRIET